MDLGAYLGLADLLSHSPRPFPKQYLGSLWVDFDRLVGQERKAKCPFPSHPSEGVNVWMYRRDGMALMESKLRSLNDTHRLHESTCTSPLHYLATGWARGGLLQIGQLYRSAG